MTSIGTRKKVVDFQKILISKVDGELSDDNTNKTSIYHKDSIKKNKTRSKRSNLLKTKRNREKDELIQNEVSEAANLIDKKEYFDIMNKFSDEYKQLGYDLASKSSEQSKMNVILSKLYIDLFSMTKFENSKPHKMIDYIIHNDRMFALSDVDKTTFEKMKKKIFVNKGYDLNSSSSTILKSLYQYLKVDFTTSRIIKIFENINKMLNEVCMNNNSMSHSNSNLEINANNPPVIQYQMNSNSNEQDEDITSIKNDDPKKINSVNNLSTFPEEDTENKHKDKFTYQKFISDKLKNYSSSCNINDELNDSDLYKSLIYLCNKNYRNYPRMTIPSSKQSTKIEQEFLQNLNNNLSILEEYGNNIEKLNSNYVRLNNRLPIYKKLKSKVINYTRKIFREIKYKKFDMNLLKKILELFIRYKEDDISTIQDKLKELVNDLEIDKEDLKTLRLYMKLYFQIINLNERKLYINDEKFWKIMNDYFKSESYTFPLKPKSRKKNNEAGNDNTENIETNSSKKRRSKQNDGDASDKCDANNIKIKEKEVKIQQNPRNIFMVFKDININDDIKSEDSNPSKKEEPKKRKRRTKKEMKEETENQEQTKNTSNVITNETRQLEIKQENNDITKSNVEVETTKIVNPKKKRKPRTETQENQNPSNEQITDSKKEEDDKNEEVKVSKPRKSRKKLIESTENKEVINANDIMMKDEKDEEKNKYNDVKIETIPPENSEPKKKVRQKKIKQESIPENNVYPILLNNPVYQAFEETMIPTIVGTEEPEKVKKTKKVNRKSSNAQELNSSKVPNSANDLPQQHNFFNNSLIEQFQLSNQFNNTSNTINNNINNNININNNYNNPEIKNINIVYSGDLNNRIQLASLFPNNNINFLNFDLWKNIAHTIHPLNSINQSSNIENFFENGNENLNDIATTPLENDQIKYDTQNIPFLNIPVIIPVNELLNHNSQALLNPKYNPIFYNNFYQKIIEYNKNVAVKLSNEDIPIIEQTSNLKQKRKYNRKKKSEIDISAVNETTNGYIEIENSNNPNIEFPDLMINNEILNEVKIQKNINMAKKKKSKKVEENDVKMNKEQEVKK